MKGAEGPGGGLQAAGWPALMGIALARFALNLPARIFYPFLPAIGRALGVPLTTASLLLTARAAASALSPLYGMLADRWGRRPLMLAGLALLVAAAGMALVAPTFAWVLVAFALLATAKACYDPAMFAYLGDHVPYSRRGQVMGLLSMTWPGVWLLGVPAAGLLIGTFGWRSPLVAVAVLGAIAWVVAWRTVDRDAPKRAAQPRRSLPAAHWLTVPALGALAVNLLQLMANENMLIVYGAWLEGQYGLSVRAIGLAAIIVALAEFSAEGLSAGLVDRTGKRRAVLAGLSLSVLAYGLLPLLAGQLPIALAGVFAMVLVYDFSIVTMLALLSELAPAARATLMALNVAALAAARLISSVVAPRLWDAGGLPLTALTSMALAALALLTMWITVREVRRTLPTGDA